MLRMLKQTLGRKAKLGKAPFILATTAVACAMSTPALASGNLVNASTYSLTQTNGFYLLSVIAASILFLPFLKRSKS